MWSASPDRRLGDRANQRTTIRVHFGERATCLVDHPQIVATYDRSLRVAEEIGPLVLHIINGTAPLSMTCGTIAELPGGLTVKTYLSPTGMGPGVGRLVDRPPRAPEHSTWWISP
jgi:hypothetical protein